MSEILMPESFGKMTPSELAWAEDSLRANLHSANREFIIARENLEKAKKNRGKFNEVEFLIVYERQKKKIAAIRTMLQTIEAEKNQNVRKFPLSKSKVFISTAKRDFQHVDKNLQKVDVPNFYRGEHEWLFGLESR